MEKEKSGIKTWSAGEFWSNISNEERVLNTTGTKLIFIAINCLIMIGWFIKHFSFIGLGIIACEALLIYILCFKKADEKGIALSYLPLLLFSDAALIIGTLYQDIGKIDWSQLSNYIKSAFPEGNHTHPSAYLILLLCVGFFIIAGSSKYNADKNDKKKYVSIGIVFLGLFIAMLQWAHGNTPIPSFRIGGGVFLFIYVCFSTIWIIALLLTSYERSSTSHTGSINLWLTIIIVSTILLFSIIGVKYLEKTLPLLASAIIRNHSIWPFYIFGILMIVVGVVIYTIGEKKCIIDGLWLTEFGMLSLIFTQLKTNYFPFCWLIPIISLLMWKQSNKLHTSEESSSINLIVSIVIQLAVLISVGRELSHWAWDRVIVLMAFYALVYMSASTFGNAKTRFNFWTGLALLIGAYASCYVRMNLLNKDSLIIIGGVTLLGVISMIVLNWPSNLKITSSLWTKIAVLILMTTILLPVCKSYTAKVDVDFDYKDGVAVIEIEDDSNEYFIKGYECEWTDIKGLFKDDAVKENIKIGANSMSIKGDQLVINITDSANRTMTVVRWYPKTLFEIIMH